MQDTLGGSGCGSAKATPVGGLDVLTLQTINEQQLIIFRQKELVSTLKERVEELEDQQREADLKLTEAARKSSVIKGTLSYETEVQLRRRVGTLEGENKKLNDRVDKLCAELSTTSEQLYAQQLRVQKETDVWKAKASNAEAKSVAAAHLLEAMDKRNRKLFNQLEKLRREGEVTAYECAQWRSLAITAVSHLDQDNRRYASDQINSIEEDVRRYAVNRLSSLRVAASASVSLDGETPEEARKMWSRSAQLPKVHPMPDVLPQQETVHSLLHLSYPPPLSPPLAPRLPRPAASRALSLPTSEKANAEMQPSPPPPAAASCRFHTNMGNSPSTFKGVCATPFLAEAKGGTNVVTSPMQDAYLHLNLLSSVEKGGVTSHNPPLATRCGPSDSSVETEAGRWVWTVPSSYNLDSFEGEFDHFSRQSPAESA
ncbi:hypothetical protein Q4I30_000348 [Leishmania utingensis]|uniref:Uncharacterized protein n=1 Tax=Leishmania utingensis TaxID=653362 RepID=A0AAW3B306_9TRYP